MMSGCHLVFSLVPFKIRAFLVVFAALFTKKSVREQKPKLTTKIKKSRPEFNISNLSSVVNAKYFIFDMMLASVFKELTGTKKIFFGNIWLKFFYKIAKIRKLKF